LKYQEPKHKDIRIDTGVQEGDEISMYYDPIISKTVTWAKSRPEAIELMKYALDNYVVRGVGHNLPFCRDVLCQPAFVSGNYSTKFIQETYPDGFKPMPFSEAEVHELLAIIAGIKNTENMLAFKPEEFESGFVVEVQEEFYAVWLEAEKLHLQKVDTDGNLVGEPKVVKDASIDWDGHRALIPSVIEGKQHYSQIVSKSPRGYELVHKARSVKVNLYKPREFEYIKHMPKVDTTLSAKQVLAPMPGAVISVAVKLGDKVNIGQELGMLEAMKMRNVIRSERAGVIKAVYTKEGASVQIDELLFEFE
jgi:propionyl-CoA carboxylase alpha chain